MFKFFPVTTKLFYRSSSLNAVWQGWPQSLSSTELLCRITPLSTLTNIKKGGCLGWPIMCPTCNYAKWVSCSSLNLQSCILYIVELFRLRKANMALQQQLESLQETSRLRDAEIRQLRERLEELLQQREQRMTPVVAG